MFETLCAGFFVPNRGGFSLGKARARLFKLFIPTLTSKERNALQRPAIVCRGLEPVSSGVSVARSGLCNRCSIGQRKPLLALSHRKQGDLPPKKHFLLHFYCFIKRSRPFRAKLASKESLSAEGDSLLSFSFPFLKSKRKDHPFPSGLLSFSPKTENLFHRHPTTHHRNQSNRPSQHANLINWQKLNFNHEWRKVQRFSSDGMNHSQQTYTH